MQRVSRLKQELKVLNEQPLPNIAIYSLFQNDTRYNDKLKAQIIGSKESVYQNGVFDLEILIPDKYPLVAPIIRFLTPIYHPNIDNSGRICLDILTNANKWKPSINLSVLLLSIQSLLETPNPDDPLHPEIAFIYKNNFELFKINAQRHTIKYASQVIKKIKKM